MKDAEQQSIAIANIKRILNQKNMKQKDLAAKVGISPSQMSMYLTNGASFSLQKLTAIAKALDVDVSQLLQEKQDNSIITVGLFTAAVASVFSLPAAGIMALAFGATAVAGSLFKKEPEATDSFAPVREDIDKLLKQYGRWGEDLRRLFYRAVTKRYSVELAELSNIEQRDFSADLASGLKVYEYSLLIQQFSGALMNELHSEGIQLDGPEGAYTTQCKQVITYVGLLSYMGEAGRRQLLDYAAFLTDTMEASTSGK